MGRLVVRNITNTKMQTKKPTSALAEMQRKKRYFVFFNGFFKLSNICGGTQVLAIVIFKDISALTEPILIKQRWFCHLNCMFFQIWHSVFHFLTTKLFCVVPTAPELNYPFNNINLA